MRRDQINIKLILEGCLQGNRNSQRKLYEYYHGYGISVCLRYSNNRQEAVEILNDAFLKVFTHLNQYDTTCKFKPWLRRILVNSAIDYYRKYKQKINWVELNPNLESAEIKLSLPSNAFDQDLLPVVQQLPPAYRMVFNLYVMEGYKHQEIAEQLGISVGTSRSNLLRAKAKLRTMLLKKSNQWLKMK